MGSSFSSLDKHISCTGFGLSSNSRPTKKTCRNLEHSRTNSCLSFGGCVPCPTNTISSAPISSNNDSGSSSGGASTESSIVNRHDQYKILHCSCRPNYDLYPVFSCQQPESNDLQQVHSNLGSSLVSRHWTLATLSSPTSSTTCHLILPSNANSKLPIDLNCLNSGHSVCLHRDHEFHLGDKWNFATFPRTPCHQNNSNEFLSSLVKKDSCLNYSVNEFRRFIDSWSCRELFCLCLEYEALHEEHFIEFESIKSRPKAPTLDDDLRGLCDKGWCSNLYLRYRGSLYATHAYILAIRSTTFYKLLSSLFDLGNCTCEPATISQDLAIVFPQSLNLSSNCLSTELSKSSSNLIGNQLKPSLSDYPKLQNSPDLLSNRRKEFDEPNSKSGVQSQPDFQTNRTNGTHDNLTTNRITGTTTTTINADSDTGSKTDTLFADFLMRLYTASDSKSLLDKPKPDLLHGPEMFGEPSSVNLALLYQLSLTINPNLATPNPIAPDCLLIFAHPPGSNFEPVKLSCHAGILACRSLFLRRLLAKRYNPILSNPVEQNTIVLDGNVVPPHLGQIILHFVYHDYLDLGEIANLMSVSENPNLNRIHSEWHQLHRLDQPDCASCYEGKQPNYCTVQPEIRVQRDPLVEPKSSSGHGEHGSSKFEPFYRLGLKKQSNWFCPKCPFCISRVVELHPMGHILEFKRLSEACEDLLINALNLTPNYDTTHQTSPMSKIPCMSPISLAIGLLDWASGTNDFCSPSTSLNELSTDLGISNLSTNQCDNSESRDYHSSTLDHRSHPNCSSDQDTISNRHFQDEKQTVMGNFSIASRDKCASTRLIYRHAMHCLRRNFIDLVRSPALGRMKPEQLYELINSNFVQSTEVEIFAALLYWAEYQLNAKRTTTLHKKCKETAPENTQKCESKLSSPSSHGLHQDKVNSNYHSLVSSLMENPDILSNQPSESFSYPPPPSSLPLQPSLNSWLLLNFYDEYCLNSIQTSNQNPCWNKTITGPPNTNSNNHCHLCLIDQTHSTPKIQISELIHSLMKSKHNELPNLISLLQEHGLLNVLRPSHLLTRLPHELATLLLRFYVNTTMNQLAWEKSPKSARIRSWITNLCSSTPNNRTTDQSTHSDSLISDSPQLFWIPLFDSIDRMSKSKISYQNYSKVFWAHLLQKPKSDPKSNAHTLCSCQWSTTSSGDRLDDRSCPTQLNPHHSIDPSLSKDLQPAPIHTNQFSSEYRPPRLFYPFLEEVRTRFMQKHVFHHRNLQSNPTESGSHNSHGPISECTCWRSLSIHQSAANSEELKPKCTSSDPQMDFLLSSKSSGLTDYSQIIQKPSLDTLCDLNLPELIRKLADTEIIHKSKFDSVSSLCCDYRCREFANCLLTPTQWTNLIDFYLKLDREFRASSASRHPCVNIESVFRSLRFQSLWKFGLPDSLEPLFQCRINERLFTIQQPKQTTNNPTKIQPQFADFVTTNTTILDKHQSVDQTDLPSDQTCSTMSRSESIRSDGLCRSYESCRLVPKSDRLGSLQSSTDESCSSPKLSLEVSHSQLDYCPACQNEFEHLQTVPTSEMDSLSNHRPSDSIASSPSPLELESPNSFNNSDNQNQFECDLCEQTARMLDLNQNSKSSSRHHNHHHHSQSTSQDCNCLLGSVSVNQPETQLPFFNCCGNRSCYSQWFLVPDCKFLSKYPSLQFPNNTNPVGSCNSLPSPKWSSLRHPSTVDRLIQPNSKSSPPTSLGNRDSLQLSSTCTSYSETAPDHSPRSREFVDRCSYDDYAVTNLSICQNLTDSNCSSQCSPATVMTTTYSSIANTTSLSEISLEPV